MKRPLHFPHQFALKILPLVINERRDGKVGAGIQNGRIDLAKLGRHLLHHCLHLPGICNVGLDRDGPVACLFDLGNNVIGRGAVRHYFGGKEQLYREVVVRAHHELVDHEPVPRMNSGDDPQAALRNWVRYLLRIFLLRRATHPFAGQLIAWELREPTPALDELIAEVLGPVRNSLNQIVAAALGDADEPELRARCANFVHGICVFHDQNRELLRRFGHPIPSTEKELVALADTIVTFAMAGIERLRTERTSTSRRNKKTK